MSSKSSAGMRVLAGGFRLNDPIVASCGFSGCIMPARGSAGNESESERLPFIIDSIPALISNGKIEVRYGNE